MPSTSTGARRGSVSRVRSAAATRSPVSPGVSRYSWVSFSHTTVRGPTRGSSASTASGRVGSNGCHSRQPGRQQVDRLPAGAGLAGRRPAHQHRHRAVPAGRPRDHLGPGLRRGRAGRTAAAPAGPRRPSPTTTGRCTSSTNGSVSSAIGRPARTPCLPSRGDVAGGLVGFQQPLPLPHRRRLLARPPGQHRADRVPAGPGPAAATCRSPRSSPSSAAPRTPGPAAVCVSRHRCAAIRCAAWSHSRASSASTTDAAFGPPAGRNGAAATAPLLAGAIRIRPGQIRIQP